MPYRIHGEERHVAKFQIRLDRRQPKIVRLEIDVPVSRPQKTRSSRSTSRQPQSLAGVRGMGRDPAELATERMELGWIVRGHRGSDDLTRAAMNNQEPSIGKNLQQPGLESFRCPAGKARQLHELEEPRFVAVAAHP